MPIKSGFAISKIASILNIDSRQCINIICCSSLQYFKGGKKTYEANK